jgi:hypothetical protein
MLLYKTIVFDSSSRSITIDLEQKQKRGPKLTKHPVSFFQLHLISDHSTALLSLYVTLFGRLYVDNSANTRIDKWSWDVDTSTLVMTIIVSCFCIYVDITKYSSLLIHLQSSSFILLSCWVSCGFQSEFIRWRWCE